MSSRRFTWRDHVWESTLTPNQRLVAFALERFMSSTDLGDARPSVDTLCRCTGLGERTVQRCLRELVRAGWIRIIEPARQHRATTYQGRIPGTPEAPLGVPPATSSGANFDIQRRTYDTRSRTTDPSNSDPDRQTKKRGRAPSARENLKYLDQALDR